MADIHIVRAHALGLEHARKLAFRWAEVAEKKLDMECTYTEGRSSDLVSFRRPGAHGELKVTAHRFELSARLGLLLGVFKQKIETEIVKNLDHLLEHEDPLHAFEHGLAKHEGRHEAKHAPRHAKPHHEAHEAHHEAHKAAHHEAHKAAAKPATEAHKAAAKPATKAKTAPAKKAK